MKKEYLTHFRNFKKYDSSGRKLSIFADLVGNSLRFCVFRCSKEDIFSKNTAIKMYETYKNQTIQSWINKANYGNPLVFDLKVEDLRYSKKIFLSYCAETFCFAYPSYGIVKIEYLNNVQVINKLKKVNKK